MNEQQQINKDLCRCCNQREVGHGWRDGMLVSGWHAHKMLCLICLERRRQLWHPTRALPGTKEKIKIMEERHNHMLPLFHPGDVRWDEGLDTMLAELDGRESIVNVNKFNQRIRFDDDESEELCQVM